MKMKMKIPLLPDIHACLQSVGFLCTAACYKDCGESILINIKMFLYLTLLSLQKMYRPLLTIYIAYSVTVPCFNTEQRSEYR